MVANQKHSYIQQLHYHSIQYSVCAGKNKNSGDFNILYVPSHSVTAYVITKDDGRRKIRLEGYGLLVAVIEKGVAKQKDSELISQLPRSFCSAYSSAPIRRSIKLHNNKT